MSTYPDYRKLFLAQIYSMFIQYSERMKEKEIIRDPNSVQDEENKEVIVSDEEDDKLTNETELNPNSSRLAFYSEEGSLGIDVSKISLSKVYIWL